MALLKTTWSWDAVETPSGQLMLIVPRIDRPRNVLAAGDGIYIGTEGDAIYLARSAGLSPGIARCAAVIIVEADEAIARETAAPVRRTASRFIKGHDDA